MLNLYTENILPIQNDSDLPKHQILTLFFSLTLLRLKTSWHFHWLISLLSFAKKNPIPHLLCAMSRVIQRQFNFSLPFEPWSVQEKDRSRNNTSYVVFATVLFFVSIKRKKTVIKIITLLQVVNSSTYFCKSTDK